MHPVCFNKLYNLLVPLCWQILSAFLRMSILGNIKSSFGLLSKNIIQSFLLSILTLWNNVPFTYFILKETSRFHFLWALFKKMFSAKEKLFQISLFVLREFNIKVFKLLFKSVVSVQCSKFLDFLAVTIWQKRKSHVVLLLWNKLPTVVGGDPKAPFSIATTPRCRGGHYSLPWIGPLYSLS